MPRTVPLINHPTYSAATMRASLDMRPNIAARGPANNQIATKCGFARTKSAYVRLNRCSYSQLTGAAHHGAE
jgi:hypothetical protein